MMKVGKVYRENITKTLRDGLEKQSTAFVLNFRNVSSSDICTLRKTLQKSKAKVYLSRNSLARVALKGTAMASISDTLEGQTLFIWTNSDAVDVAKVLIKFVGKNENIVIRGGVVSSQLLQKEDIKRLSELPAKEVLLAQLLGTLQSPITRLARTLNGKTVELLSILKQISEKTGGN
ncbi:MAG: 50S ribosomal protein L10 [Candidatus Omnitrophica bacterium]|nr:50S ribosomal protein L10 [Candidatus Omnitrophota bacterium]